MRITVIGAGLGKIELLTQKSIDLIQTADLVISTDRLYEKFKGLNKNSCSLPLTEIAERVKASVGMKTIVILASGDVGFYSISKMLKTTLEGYDVTFLSGTSSLQYLTSKMQISYVTIRTVSVHGREQSAIPFVCYNERVLVENIRHRMSLMS
ncbi:MAG: precorrin-6y C5,15-methyltransferase (decarboxylating) subunit CbiE [Oscillospiraceae bacterium]